MSFIGVEVEQETSAPPPKKNPGSAPAVVIGQCSIQPRSQGISSSGPLERSCIIYFAFLLLALGGEPL